MNSLIITIRNPSTPILIERSSLKLKNPTLMPPIIQLDIG